jgi:23S rRNA (uridine2479-2'-O)-methyltransferase
MRDQGSPAFSGERRIGSNDGDFQVLMALKANRRKRAERREFIIEGVAPLKVALSRGWPIRAFCYARPESLSDWARGVIEGRSEVERIRLSPELMAELSDKEEPSELIAVAGMQWIELDEVELNRDSLVVVLDRPGSPGNLGSVTRSAEAFGARALVTIGHGADPFDPACLRASLGAAFALPLAREPSMEEFAAWLARERGRLPELAVLGTDSGGELNYESAPLRPPCVLLFGNEAKGLSLALNALCDGIVSIPMRGAVNSLNLACAATIFIHRAASGRREKS